MKKNALNIIAWTLIILGLVMLLWKTVDGSPGEIYILSTIIAGLLFKMWTVDSELKEFRGGFKGYKKYLEEKFGHLDERFNHLDKRFDVVERKLSK